MRDDLPDATLKMALSNSMQGLGRDSAPGLVARKPDLMRRLAKIIEDQDTREHWGLLVQLYEAACAIVAADKATEAIENLLKKELRNER